MTKPNAFVFYFAFDNDEQPNATYGFIVPDAAAVFEKFYASGFEDMVEQLYDTDQFDRIESAFGVHDWSTAPSPEVDAIGFNTYEVAPDQIATLMELWRDVFTTSTAPGPVVEIPETVTLGDDAAIYKYIAETYEKG